MIFVDNNRTTVYFCTKKPIISFDFDDTLRNTIDNKVISIKTKFLLSIIQNSNALDIYPIIVTSRQQNLYEIDDFCVENNIDNRITYVVHSVIDKASTLKEIGASIHFDDDISTISDLYGSGVLGFLSGEWLDKDFYDLWINKLENDGIKQYYNVSHLNAKKMSIDSQVVSIKNEA